LEYSNYQFCDVEVLKTRETLVAVRTIVNEESASATEEYINMNFGLIDILKQHNPLIGQWMGTMWLGQTFTVYEDGSFTVESSGVTDGEVWINLRTADFLLKQANLDEVESR